MVFIKKLMCSGEGMKASSVLVEESVALIQLSGVLQTITLKRTDVINVLNISIEKLIFLRNQIEEEGMKI